ncbi:hypothetical protein [Diaphorobacter nitroreducens]|uniref:hypothetical protein n=1 Tax=Diaphorobacter nitroreducens TaxID=164759 RepID=UPI0011E4CF2D|nr:hypothetical protein [Diaphorobacter nitroreducens]
MSPDPNAKFSGARPTECQNETNSERVYLGDKSKRVCRYCGLAEPQVKFRKVAHAIPDQVGNDWLVDHEECDAFNGHFAKWVEDDFGKWTLPWRTLGRVKGKDGVPSIKSNDKEFRIDASAKPMDGAKGAGSVRHDFQIYMGVNDARHELDEATNTVKLTLDRPSYAPMGVFKCLVKKAIAVMPPEEEQRCAHLKKWILLPAHTFESYGTANKWGSLTASEDWGIASKLGFVHQSPFDWFRNSKGPQLFYLLRLCKVKVFY